MWSADALETRLSYGLAIVQEQERGVIPGPERDFRQKSENQTNDLESANRPSTHVCSRKGTQCSAIERKGSNEE